MSVDFPLLFRTKPLVRNSLGTELGGAGGLVHEEIKYIFVANIYLKQIYLCPQISTCYFGQNPLSGIALAHSLVGQAALLMKNLKKSL
jgi:hypothetical protein